MIPVAQAAKLSGKNRRTIYRWIADGLLKTKQSKFGPLLVDEAQVQAMRPRKRGKKP